MDTLIVFCALMVSAFLMSLTWTGIYCLITYLSREKPQRKHALYTIDPFEPASTTEMHYDPRMIQRARSKAFSAA